MSAQSVMDSFIEFQSIEDNPSEDSLKQIAKDLRFSVSVINMLQPPRALEPHHVDLLAASQHCKDFADSIDSLFTTQPIDQEQAMSSYRACKDDTLQATMSIADALGIDTEE